ncbi:MAG: BBP7 family outer membrane beta-barrel protein [Pirellulales bacterium]
MIGLIMTAVIGIGDALAQEMPPPDASDAMSPSEPALPSDESIGPFASEEMPLGDSEPTGESSILTGEQSLTVDSLEGCDDYSSGPQDWWDDYSAPIESTGTWLRRGFWYAEAEVAVWNRFWNRDSKFLAAQDVNVLDPNFFPRGGNPGQIQPVFNTNRLLMLDGSQPGEDASVRVKLGNFLFRDSHNRDHLAEMTVLGGGDWHQHRELASENPFGLFVPFYISGNNRTWNASSRQVADYSSTFRSFEANYRVRSRMRRDQLVMDANGHWHRAANQGFSKEFLAGLRMMELRDIFNWTAEDIQVVGNDGSYMIRTDNDLFGFQLGAGTTYETARWSLGADTKMGFYSNDALKRATLNFTADDDSDSDLRSPNDSLSWLVEVHVTGRWHMTPNSSLRASYELMYLTSMALAPNQANFITDLSYLNTSGDALYHGMSFGFERYW